MNLAQLRRILFDDQLTWRDRAQAVIEISRSSTQKELEDHFLVLIRAHKLDVEALIIALDEIMPSTNPLDFPELSHLAGEIKKLESKCKNISSEHNYVANLQTEIQNLNKLKKEQLKLKESIQFIIETVKTDIERIDVLRKEVGQ
jgi:hypothetical protein